MIIPTPTDHAYGQEANLQVSIEGDRIGLDWVLASAGNLAGKERFVSFAHEHGLQLASRHENGVDYLRTEDPNALIVSNRLLKEVYGLGDNTELDMIVERFDW